ncbi:hypothetical protein ACA910_007115 [Epithemia clementina (nom. ined.)]
MVTTRQAPSYNIAATASGEEDNTGGIYDPGNTESVADFSHLTIINNAENNMDVDYGEIHDSFSNECEMGQGLVQGLNIQAAFPNQHSGQVGNNYYAADTEAMSTSLPFASVVSPQPSARDLVAGVPSDELGSPLVPHNIYFTNNPKGQSRYRNGNINPSMGLANQAASEQWTLLPFVAQEDPPTLAVQRYGTESLVQGRNIQAKFPNNMHFVCGPVMNLLHHREFTETVLKELMQFMPEIRLIKETDRNGVRTYVPYVAKVAREKGFKIWTALTLEEQPGAMPQPQPHHIHSFNVKAFDKEWFQDITNNEERLKERLESRVRTILRTYLKQHPAPSPQEGQRRLDAPHPVQLANTAHRVQGHRSPMNYELIVRGFLDKLNQDTFKDPLYNLYATLRESKKNHEEWALDIYSNLRVDADDKRAKKINEYRGHLLNNWLYKLVDKWGEFGFCDEFAWAIKSVLKNRLANILRVCLVLDRANALCVMESIWGQTPPGMDWFCALHLEPCAPSNIHWTDNVMVMTEWKRVDQWWKQTYPMDFRPLMNKRLFRLIYNQHLGLYNDANIFRWAQPAVSPYRPHEAPLINFPQGGGSSAEF